MDAPPPNGDPRPFIAVAEWLGECGLSAPQILARDLNRGLLLIEDFGDVRLRETMSERPEAAAQYYAGVTYLIVHLQSAQPMAGLPVPWPGQRLDEVMRFPAWEWIGSASCRERVC